MAPTTYPPYLREKARELRRERKLTIDQLAECLALPRTTIYYWVKDLPIPRTNRQNRAQRRGVAAYWIRRLGANQVTYWLQYHADQDLHQIQLFWAQQLGVHPELIRLQRKSNSNQLAGRRSRSRYGVLGVVCSDTYFRARLQAWMDCVKDDWLHSLDPVGV